MCEPFATAQHACCLPKGSIVGEHDLSSKEELISGGRGVGTISEAEAIVDAGHRASDIYASVARVELAALEAGATCSLTIDLHTFTDERISLL